MLHVDVCMYVVAVLLHTAAPVGWQAYVTNMNILHISTLTVREVTNKRRMWLDKEVVTCKKL